MLLLLAALCGLLEAVFTALEVALGTVSRARLRALQSTPQGEAEAAPSLIRQTNGVLKLLERPDRLALLFITITSLSLWSAASLLTWSALSQHWDSWVLPLALVGLLFVAEVLPLLIAARHAEAIALRGAGLIRLALKIWAPLLWILGGIAYGLAQMLGSGPGARPDVTEGELRTALAAAEEEGVIESDERALLEGAMDFREKVVREVMTSRLDIIGVPAEASLPQALEIALSQGHSRLPVYAGSLDKIVGVLATKDVLPFLKSGDSLKTAGDVARETYFVPENKKLTATLDELRRGRTLLAIVVDESGGTAGLVTLEDLLEELVGEIQDEYDLEEAPLRAVEGAEKPAVLCDASATVRDFGRFWGREFKMVSTLRGADGERAESSETLAALALELFEDVPRVGDKVGAGDAIAVTPDIRAHFDLELQVVKMDGPRIEEVCVALVESGTGDNRPGE